MTVKKVCKTCGSESVWRDATAVWNVAAQEWRLGADFSENEWCNQCDCETTIVEKEITLPHKLTVMLHGFHKLSCGASEHCDFDDPDCENWNVWVRRDFETGPFDSVDEHDRDFVSFDEAWRYATDLQIEIGGEIDCY